MAYYNVPARVSSSTLIEQLPESVVARQSTPPYQGNRRSSSPMTLTESIQHEVMVTERLLRSNFVGFLFIFFGGLLSRVIAAPVSIIDTTIGTGKALAVGLLCSYVFDICNQTTSPAEDYINKPHRPIPAGLITVEQGQTRWILVWALGPLVVYHFFGIWAAGHLVEWEALITFCYVWPRRFSWFMRSFFAAFDYCILGRLLNQVLSTEGFPATWDISFLTDATIFAWFMGTIHIQEFYDLEGDRNSDRETLPMLLSERGLRVLRAGTSIYLLAFGGALAFASSQRMDKDYITAPISLLQLTSSCVLAYRIWASPSPEMDRRTYHVYYYIPTLFTLLSLVLVTI